MAGSNNVLGIIFANINDEVIPQLTNHRTLASVPFGGKYRLIDFPLSNMSNSGINNVGVITESNYLSLMDHVGSGNAWDLSKRKSGLSIIPPNAGKNYDNEIEIIFHLREYFEHFKEEYVILCYANTVANIDYKKMYYDMISKDADISLLYIKGKKDENSVFPMVAKLGDDKRVEELQFNPETDEECNVFANSLMIKKDFMMSLVAKCASTNRVDLVREMLNMDLEKIKVVGFEQEGFLRNICSMQDYYDVSMELMDEDVRDELFYQQRPIYTKIRDDIPSRYGFESSVSSSLIAQGCTVEGKVKNSILSKSVAIGKNAQIENCIIMQDTVIGEGSKLSNVIIDKDCVISENTQMIGAKNYPVFISKGSVL